MENVNEMQVNESEGLEIDGIITKWIERYYADKLDRREKKPGGPGIKGSANAHGGVLTELLSNN